MEGAGLLAELLELGRGVSEGTIHARVRDGRLLEVNLELDPPSGGDGRTYLSAEIELELDPARRLVTLRGEPLDLGPREFEYLALVAAHLDEHVSSRAILTRFWGAEYELASGVLHSFVKRLRRGLPPEVNARLLGERGGYRLVRHAPPRSPSARGEADWGRYCQSEAGSQGGSSPLHRATPLQTLEVWDTVIKGKQIVGAKVLERGDFCSGPTGVEHGPFDYPEGCVVFAVFQGNPIHEY